MLVEKKRGGVRICWAQRKHVKRAYTDRLSQRACCSVSEVLVPQSTVSGAGGVTGGGTGMISLACRFRSIGLFATEVACVAVICGRGVRGVRGAMCVPSVWGAVW